MAGIYIHIPFCRQACHYCNFHFSTQHKSINDFIEALLNEATLRSTDWKNITFETIYFGGGTPSLLNGEQIKLILQCIKKYYNINSAPEITIECNPEDVTAGYVTKLVELGINRLSIGIQSFHDKHLQMMNRSHKSQQAIESIQAAQAAGIKNITVDLIYGLPELHMHEWIENLMTIEQLCIPHLSCYSLTIEERTALAHFVKNKKMIPVDDEATLKQYETLLDWSRQKGITQYEISNFAKPGFESIHNSNYWKGKPYLGLGPSAHSYKDGTRSMNKANNPIYIKSLLNKELPETITETLTQTNRFNELIMLNLRMVAGLHKNALTPFPDSLIKYFKKQAEPLLQRELLIYEEDSYRLTHEGQMLSDYVISHLFYPD